MRHVLALLLLLIGGYFGIGDAQAACNGTTCDTKPEAYAKVAWTGSDFCPVYGLPNAAESATYTESDVQAGGAPGRVTASYKCNGSQVATASATWTALCKAGETYDAASNTCKVPKECKVTDPPLGPSWVQGDYTSPSFSIYVCNDECSYIMPSGQTTVGQRTIDGQLWSETTGFVPTGSACTPGASDTSTPPSDSDGDGTSDGNDSAPNNPGEGDPQPPAPAEGTCGGAGQPPCPSQESDPDKSTGGGDCKTPPSSSGNPILAQIAFQTWATRCSITGLANGGGTVPGKGDGEGGAVTGEGIGETGLYEPTEKTVGSVYATFKTDVEQSPLISAASGFFSGCNSGGSCPSASWSASEWGISFDLSQLCGGDLSSLLGWAGWVAFAGFAWFAFKLSLL